MASRFFGARGKKRSRFFDTSEVSVQVVEAGTDCSRCGAGTLEVRVGRFGPFLGCTSYPSCRSTAPVAGGDAAGRRRADEVPHVRMEIESTATVRCWSTAAKPSDQELLRSRLAECITVVPCALAPRADWTSTAARLRASAVFPLSAHDEVCRQLQEDGMRVQPVPPSTLTLFCGIEKSDEPPTAGEDAHEGMERIPERLRSILLGFQLRGIEQVLRWGGRALLADEMVSVPPTSRLWESACSRPHPLPRRARTRAWNACLAVRHGRTSSG